MGIIKGSLTLTRYQVRGDLPAETASWLDERIKRHKFRDIEEGTEELAAGWVSPHDFLDTEFAFASWSLDPFVMLGLRVDRRRLPAALVRKYARLEMQRARRASETGRLGRSQREELKERARLDLLRRLPPETALFDVCWDTAGHRVLLGSATGWVREVFEELFTRCFELRILAQTPWELVSRLAAGDQARRQLEGLSPMSLYQGED